MTDLDVLAEFLQLLRSRSGSEHTVSNYHRQLLRFRENHGDLLAAQKSDIRAYQRYLSEDRGLTAGSVRFTLAVLKSFYKFCVDEDILEKSPCAGIVRPKLPVRVLNPLRHKEVQKLIESCDIDSKKIHVRNRVIVEFLLATGLRRSELANLKMIDVDLKSRSFVVIGKGNKQRRVFFSHQVKESLSQYIQERPSSIYDTLFLTQTGQPLTHWSIYLIVKKALRDLGLPGSTHTLRRTYATSLYKAGMDIYKLQKLMGHTSIQTTTGYVQMCDEDLRDSYDEATAL
jgi:site-specific recombinase XerD